MTIVGLNSRAVEVIYEGHDKEGPFWEVGSGSFVCPNLVLTASHCIPPVPGKLRVRLCDGREYQATVRLQADKDKVDLAVLEVSDATVEVPVLRYGEINRNVSGIVKECRAIGFPWFKRRDDKLGAPRFSAQVDGEIPTGENYGQSILTLQITNKNPRPLPDNKSEWAGISGAVVFSSNDIIIGVLTEHHLPEGESALAVVPITAIDDLLPSYEAEKWWQLLRVDRQAFMRLPDEESFLLSHIEWYKQQTLFADKTRGFVGRQHVFEKIEKFFKDQDSGYLLIEGDPGIGKSSILAEYVRRTGCIAHFNVRGQGIVKASQFLENVCSQLIVNYRLPYPSLPAKATQDGVVLGKLLQEASERLQSGERLVIAVDALDEIDPNAQLGCSNCLCLPSRLPNGVYFIMTKRPRIDYVRLEAPQELLDLMLFPAENRSDVEQYIVRRAEQPKVRSWIEQQKIPTVEAFVKKLAELSKDNFMYLWYVLGDIEKGKYQDLSIEKLPIGLEGYYEDHWRRMGMMAHPLPRLKILTVYILSETPDPISFDMISNIFDRNNYKVNAIKLQSILAEWGQFLHEQPAPEGKRYSIYHSSFRDFLNRQDIVHAAGVTIKGIKNLITEYLLIELYGNEGDKI